MNYTAYLVIHFSIPPEGQHIPRFKHLGIYSSSAAGLTALPGEIYADISWDEADSYQEAKNRLIRQVGLIPAWRWMLPWVDTSFEAHQQRYELYKLIEK